MPTFRTSQPVSAGDLAAKGTPHLILVGLPGAGKSSVGRAVAEALGRQFLDFDIEIERREYLTIGELFASKGETHFRALELALTQEVSALGNMILAPGGGWIANPGCVALLRPPAMMVYLQVRPDIAVKRMSSGVASRPLLRRADPLSELRRILEGREQLYLQADHTVSTDKMPFQQIVSRIVALATA
jgi:shikimate kinase